MSINHEIDIPGIASQPHAIKHEQCWTELSFCLPTSMAFAKRLTWEQTPWIPVISDDIPANPITQADAYIIREHIQAHLDQNVSVTAIKNAFMFGSTYSSAPLDRPLGVYPLLFIIFPNIQQPIAQIRQFLEIWHDQIVKPAFNTAWANSGLTPVYRVDPEHRWSPVLSARGRPWDGEIYTEQDADPAARILKRLEVGNMAPLRAYWPAWTDKKPGYAQLEGQHSGIRAKVYSEAWEMILGMLKDHPNLPGFQDPILLATCRGRLDLNPDLSAELKWNMVGQQWDKYVDSRFMTKGSLKAVYKNEIGEDKSSLLGVETARVKSVSLETGGAKRVADPEQDDPLEENATKKRKQASIEDDDDDQTFHVEEGPTKKKGKTRVEEDQEIVNLLVG